MGAGIAELYPPADVATAPVIPTPSILPILKEAKEKAKSLLHTNLKFYQTALNLLLEKTKVSPKEFEQIAASFGVPVKEVKSGEKLVLDYEGMTKKFLNSKVRKARA